ncbi:MAG: hypothetical protein DBW99_02975 [SAR86 cluster bacterium]|jgi:hypothetical protein|nr:hypothetical protein [Gammaproteobacteria bacterium]RCL35701.1 MAG: hypothetical protein DBW99_02975 [SAR86 cluster bacterium]URQ69437.1 PepSY domain-containing protein [SAR86 cluster bacterium]|tara:strand:+ start:7493 stop:8101 length:609 start_codon:yes stop_codon:yes gene_type:complete
MNRSFSIRKIHRYLSIFIAIQLLLWTISGIYFAFNKIELIRGEQYRLPLDKEFRIFTRLDQQIIEENINGIKTYSTYPDGKKINVLTQEEALVIAKIKTSLIPINATLITEDSAGSEYRGRPLPLYKISTDTKDKINIYVNPMTGDILSIRSDSWRIWDFFWALHIMDYKDRENINNILLKIFSILALVTSVSGIVLFFSRK